MPRYVYSGCPRDGPIDATDTHGCGKCGLEIRGEQNRETFCSPHGELTLVPGDEQPYWPHQKATQSMKLNFFASGESATFLNLIYHGAGTVVHLLLLKSSVDQYFTICVC